MKLKRTLAVLSAMAVTVSAVPAFSVSSSAVTDGATSVDFEDGSWADYSSWIYNKADSGADISVLSLESHNGSTQLKIDVQDKSLVPKVWFGLSAIMDADTIASIYTIEYDLTITPKTSDGIVGWAGGATGAAGDVATQSNPAWSSTEWSDGAYEEGEEVVIHVERKFLLSSAQYKSDSADPFFGIMRWAVSDEYADYYMYVDNIVFKDKSGNVLTLSVASSEAEAEEEETVEETVVVEEVVEETVVETVEETVVETVVTTTTTSVDYDGTVIAEGSYTSDGSWGQAVYLFTLQNDGGTFDPSLLQPGTVVVAYYESDSTPELVLQSWSGGASWAKVPADESLSSDGVAVYTYDDMIAMYESDDLSTLDALIIGDTGAALTVTKVIVASESAATTTTVEEVVVETVVEEVVVVEETPVVVETVAVATTASTSTGNTPALAFAGVMALAGAVAVASKKRK